MNRTLPIMAGSVISIVAATTGACSGSDGSGGGAGRVIDGGSLTLAVPVDPGNLDPQRSAGGGSVAIARLAYDTPITINDDNKIEPGVLSSWKNLGSTSKWLLTVRKGITCSDGSPMAAKTVADNINYVADPKNKSPFSGAAVPVGAEATADPAANTVTVKTPSPSPFFIQSLQLLYLVCDKGLSDRSMLATKSAGSGPYVISQVVPGDHVTYTLRKGYEWGPASASSTAAKGIPAKVIVKAVTNNTTTANLLLSGQLNAAQVQGTDAKRLKSAGLYSAGGSAMNDDLIFNHASGKPTADVSVRRALVMALDMKRLGAVDGGGVGSPATGLLAKPKICPGNPLTGNLPGYDMSKAASVLDQAGWKAGSDGTRRKDGAKLSITVLYASNQAPTGAAAEFIAAQWKKIGVEVSLVQKPTDQVVSGLLNGTAVFDAALEPINVSTPAQLVPLLSGPTPPKGVNAAAIDNKQYESLTARASSKAGTTGCADWNAAEGALYKNADIVPLASIPDVWWANGARFKVDNKGVIIPTSVQIVAR